MIRPAHPMRGDPEEDPGDGEGGARFVLRLFVTAGTERSRRAVDDVRRLCEERLAGRYELEVVDVTQAPGLAGASEVYATPALVREQPAPTRRFFGDFSDVGALAAGLGLADAPRAATPARDAARTGEALGDDDEDADDAADAGRSGDRSEAAS